MATDPLSRIPLNALRAAEAVSRLGSLRLAGDELGVTPGAVSQQVARCEAAAGRQLFERSARGLVPLAEANEFLALLSDGFRRLSAAADLIRRDRAHVLTVSVAPIFAARWLIWRLGQFTAAHPDVRVRIDSDVALADPNAGDIDFAIRIGRGPYPGSHVEKLFDLRFTPVCSTNLAARIQAPQDLAHVPVIRDTHAMFTWDDWLAPEGLSATMLGDGPEFSDASLCLDAAMSGAGVFLSFETLCSDSLAGGRIVAPLPRWRQAGLSYWLVSAEKRSLSAPQRAFRRWLKQVLAESGLGG